MVFSVWLHDSKCFLLLPLLQVLQKAAIAEVVNMATDEHQVRVDVSGHAAMSWNGVVASRRDQGGTFGATLLTTLHQGTESEATRTHG